MSTTREPNTKEKKNAGFGLSLDGWAVTLALLLSLLVWAGLLKQIPW